MASGMGGLHSYGTRAMEKIKSGYSLADVVVPEPAALMPTFKNSRFQEMAEENYANGTRCNSAICPARPGGMIKPHEYMTHLGEQVCGYCGCRKSTNGGRRRRNTHKRRRTHKRRASRRNRRTARR